MNTEQRIEEKSVKDSISSMTAEDLFKAIAKLSKSCEIEENEIKKMVAELINVLKGHELTYYQANRMLEITKNALNTMSQLLNL